MKRLCFVLLLWWSVAIAHGEDTVKVGVPGVLTGDLAVMGDNIRKTIETYEKRYSRHPMKFIFEDSKKSGVDGLAAYRKLIEFDKVEMLIGGTVSNGTMAGAPIINSSKTVTVTPLTGGSNIDNAGEYIFRIGNSDLLNAKEQADQLLAKGITKVALFSEQTEYTQDIGARFREYFVQKGGTLVFDEDFLPDLVSFRSTITRLKLHRPQAIFMSTQTGLAFGIFMKEYREMNPSDDVEIHTNFVAACNPDAFKAAGKALDGVRYLAPYYDETNTRLKKFFSEFAADHGQAPAIPMHTAGTVDALDLLQKYLDTTPHFDRVGFHDFLLQEVKNYPGLMGVYSFDAKGNADIGFIPYQLRVVEGELKENPLNPR